MIYVFAKIDGFIRDYHGTKKFILFVVAKLDTICGRIRYLIGSKSGNTYVLSYKYVKIKIDSDNDLPQEETLALHNVIRLIKSVFNKN